ncbi:MAG: hypothetical protein ACRBFS_20800 [Aureispira sp.]
MINTFELPQKIRHANDDLFLMHNNGESDAFSLYTGVEISIYIDKDNNNKLTAQVITHLTKPNPAHFPVYSKVLFKGEATDPDIHGGFVKTTDDFCDKIRLAQEDNSNQTDLDILLEEVFHISIIGVDDIRAREDAPNYNQTYLMEDQKIHLKLEDDIDEEETYLYIGYARITPLKKK